MSTPSARSATSPCSACASTPSRWICRPTASPPSRTSAASAPIFSAFHSDDPKARKHRQNALLIALDPAAFGDPDRFTADVDTTLSTLKGLPSADGAAGVFYPGERSAAVAAERAEKGVPVTPKVWRELTESAERFGIAPPTPVA
ncbi:Ldh family oxidoreductase [Streptomyces phaeochromogenes]|uniref:Ldh family oxidoreductase n=1 Tax=Streptomyces phaeochromogenes TaxID=1923 RepID=UPI000D14EDCA|nr:Ldh family oxidoreductase [Streptomyces phaeochromogenes]